MELNKNPFLASIQLFFWLILKPSLWRKMVLQIDLNLSPDFALSRLTIEQWQHPILLRLLGLIYVITPILIIIIVGLFLWLLNVEPLIIIRSMIYVTTLSFVGGIIGGVIISLAFSHVAIVISGLLIGLSFIIVDNDWWYKIVIFIGTFSISISSGVLLNFIKIKSDFSFIVNLLIAIFLIGIISLILFGSVMVFYYSPLNYIFDYIGLDGLKKQLLGLAFGIWIIIGWPTRRWYWAGIIALLFAGLINILLLDLPTELGNSIFFKPVIGGVINGLIFSLTFALSYQLTSHIFNTQAGIIAGLLGSCGIYVTFFAYINSDVYIILPNIIIAILGLSAYWWHDGKKFQQLFVSFLHKVTKFSQSNNKSLEQIAVYFQQFIHNSTLKIAYTTSNKEFNNPYITGVSLTIANKNLFVGRTDTIGRIRQLLKNQRSPPILLYGQQRMGKTSLLNFFNELLPNNYVSLFADLQGPISLAENHSSFLYNLSRTLIKSAGKNNLILPSLNFDDFKDNPFMVFDEWLDDVESCAEGRILLFTFDEFESLELSFKRKNGLDRDSVLSMFRHIVQDRHNVKIIFAGLHRLDIFPSWNNYFNNAESIRIGYLQDDEARQLVTKPTELLYTKEATQHILYVTHNHPALLQLLCKEIILLKNTQESNDNLIQKDDVENAIPNLLQSGINYFGYIHQRSLIEKEILHILATQDTTFEQYPPEQLDTVLKGLVQCELIEQTVAGYKFQIDIIRRWFV